MVAFGRRVNSMKRTTLTGKNILDGYLLTLPLLIGVLIFFAIPFFLVLRNSFYRGIGYGEQFAGFDNFIFKKLHNLFSVNPINNFSDEPILR